MLHGAHLPVLVVRSAPPAGRGLNVLACHHEASAAAVAATIGKLHWPESTQGHVIAVAESLLAGPLPETVWELKGTVNWGVSPLPLPFSRRGDASSLRRLRELLLRG